MDVIDATGYDRFAAQDYARLEPAGLLTARDGLRWYLIERLPGVFDFASVEAQVRGARAVGVQVIWDLLHYGVPDDMDFFAPDFPERFARYARAAALAPHTGDRCGCARSTRFPCWPGAAARSAT